MIFNVIHGILFLNISSTFTDRLHLMVKQPYTSLLRGNNLSFPFVSRGTNRLGQFLQLGWSRCTNTLTISEFDLKHCYLNFDVVEQFKLHLSVKNELIYQIRNVKKKTRTRFVRIRIKIIAITIKIFTLLPEMQIFCRCHLT